MFSRISTKQIGVKLNPRREPELLHPGTHWYSVFAGTSVKVFPAVSTIQRLPGQEIATKDQVSVKISCAVTLHYKNPELLLKAVSDGADSLTSLMVDTLHTEVRDAEVETIISALSDFEEKLTKSMAEKAEKVGVVIESVRLRNVVLPRNLKNAYAAELTAKVEARAKLEMARSQTAAIRHLANAAKMVEDQPELIQLLALQGGNVQLGLPASKKHEK